MEQKKLIIFYIQCACFILAFLFNLIVFGGGVWWTLEQDGHKLTFTLWKICSSYLHHERCLSTTVENLTESVVVAVQVCLGIVLVLSLAVAVLLGLYFLSLRKDETDDHWLVPRSILMLLLEMFLLVCIAHAHHCPPCYFVDDQKMPTKLSWGWDMTLTSFIFLLFPCGVHVLECFLTWRDHRTKV